MLVIVHFCLSRGERKTSESSLLIHSAVRVEDDVTRLIDYLLEIEQVCFD